MRKGVLYTCLGCVLGVVWACGSGSAPRGFADGTGDDGGPGSSGLIGEGGADPGFGGEGGAATLSVALSGTVLAPNGTLPLSGALVYVTLTAPDAIEQNTFCDTCIDLPDGSFTYSGPDGTFSLPLSVAPSSQFLVVQKGQFRRVRPISFTASGPMALDAKMTTLPGKRDAANGDEIPHMVILEDAEYYDQIEYSLDKLGITGYETKPDRSLLDQPTDLAQYHIVFIPCGNQADPHVKSASANKNLSDYVSSGGKLYVTDWSYEFVHQPFPQYLAWEAQSSTIGSAATLDEWDAPATAEDPDLAAWLAATGDATFQVQGNWTTISSLNTLPGLDPMGNDTMVTPTVWVSAQKNGKIVPTTVSFPQQCGRVLFSTYHTESDQSSPLAAQEKALLYVLLEVGVCIGKQPGVH